MSTMMGVMLLSTFHLVPAQPLLTPAADYGRSYIATPGPGNSPAFLLESRCRIIDPAAKVTRDYYQCALCKAERTFASEDLFVVPGYDFLPVFSEGEVVVFRRGVTAGDGYREVSKPKWGGMTPRIVEGKYQVCADAAQVVTATKEAGLLVGQTEIRDEASGRIAILEYPIKTMNVDVAKGVWQSDTGPVLFPDLTVPPEEWSANLKLAYLAANAPDWAEFTVEEPTPIEVGDKEVARVWHNSRSLRLSVRNQILAPAEVQLVKPPKVIEEGGLLRVRLLPPKPGNPRNSEGDFVQLKDGRILFVYTHFTGGGGDHSTAYLAGRYSTDGGRTWTAEDVTVLANEGKMNIMSVSLNRLPSGEIALFYLRKNGLEDCRPYVRFSTDEAQTWSDPIECIATPGYYVVNNDRVIQLKSGRLVMPTALHLYTDAHLRPGVAMCYLSDDNGRTWYKSQSELHAPAKSGSGLQEPGVVELKDGRVMMLSRTDQGCHFRSYSSDGGVTWTEAEPTDILAPCSPATFKRIPSTGDLLLVWNDHSQERTLGGKRTPLTAAISHDDGVTWEHRKILEDDPDGWFCYMAMEFVGDNVLLSYCASDKGIPALAQTGIALFGVDWLYQ